MGKDEQIFEISTGHNELHKMTLNVLGICCPSKVSLIKRLLQPLCGVEQVSVYVPSKIVTVLHDLSLIQPAELGTNLVMHTANLEMLCELMGICS